MIYLRVSKGPRWIEITTYFVAALKHIYLIWLNLCNDKLLYELNNEYDCFTIEPWHEIPNNVVCATSKGSDQPTHTRSLVRGFACRLNIL